MKKLTILGFVFALALSALSAAAQSTGTTRPNAAGNGTVSVPPVAKVPPIAINGHKKK